MKTNPKLAGREPTCFDNRMKGPVATIPTPGRGNRIGFAKSASLALALVLCSCSEDDPKLFRIGFPYSESVWVDYMFDEAQPDEAVIAVNPYSDRIVGRRAGGIRNGVIHSDWTTEVNGTRYGWQVDLRADPPVIQIAGRAGSLNNGRFIILTDSKAQEFPRQIDIPIPAGMKSEPELRKWLDGIREAGTLALGSGQPFWTAWVDGEHAEDLNVPLLAEREMMTRILVNEMHSITGITHTQTKIETSLGEMAVTEYFRGDSPILKKVVPPDASLYTVYYVIHNGFVVLTYKCGSAGIEFAEAGVIRDQVKPDYTIKMAGSKEGGIQRITIYSPDFSKTYDGFWLRNNELIPWSAEELEGWRKMRDPGARDEK